MGFLKFIWEINMIAFLPLHSFGCVDLKDGSIFISNKLNTYETINTIVHEICHLIINNSDHDHKWFDLCKSILPSFHFIFDSNIGNIDVGNMKVAHNIGNVSGLQNILLDYYLLQHYRKASQRFLGTEGQWEVKGNNKIRLIPTPRGSFPVVVEYFPRIYQFRSTQAREICKRMMVAETKIMVGHARGKFSNIPAPGGGNMGLNGEALRTEGMQEKEKALQDAILLGEPLSVYIH